MADEEAGVMKAKQFTGMDAPMATSTAAAGLSNLRESREYLLSQSSCGSGEEEEEEEDASLSSSSSSS
jgi:hypothetical protein